MSELRKLERDLAYSAARSDIECFLESDPHGPIIGRWYQLSSASPECEEFLKDAIRYLELRKLLEHHPKSGPVMLFRTQEEAEWEMEHRDGLRGSAARIARKCCFGINARFGNRCQNKATKVSTFDGNDTEMFWCDHHGNHPPLERHGVRFLSPIANI